MIAMIRDDLQAVRDILDKDPSLVNNGSPLWYSVQMAHQQESNFAISELLLRRCADVNHVDDTRSCVLRELMINYSESHPNTAFKQAVNAFFKSLIIDWRANVNILDSLKIPAIYYAIRNANAEAVNLLVEHGATFKFLSDNPTYMLSNIEDSQILMTILCRTDAVRYLRDSSMGWDFRFFMENKPMFVLSFLEQYQKYDRLLHAKDFYPIHEILINTTLDKQRIDWINYLLQAGVPFDALNSNNETCNDVAVRRGHYYFQYKFLNCRSLYRKIILDKLDAGKLKNILAFGVPLTIRSSMMQRLDTPLHYACRVSTKSARVILDAVRQLPLEERRKVLLAKNAEGATPLDIIKKRLSGAEAQGAEDAKESSEFIETAESPESAISGETLVAVASAASSGTKPELYSLLNELCDLMQNLIDKSVVTLKQSVSLCLNNELQRKLQDLPQGIKAKIFYMAHDPKFADLPKCESFIEKAFYKSVDSSVLQQMSKKLLQENILNVLEQALEAIRQGQGQGQDQDKDSKEECVMVKLHADKSLPVVPTSRPYQTILEYCEDIQFYGLHFKWSESIANNTVSSQITVSTNSTASSQLSEDPICKKMKRWGAPFQSRRFE